MTYSRLDDAVVLAVLSTLMSMIMIGLGFLHRPRLATLLWSLMFLTITLSAYGTVVANAGDLHVLADASAGFALGAPVLVWSGLRADRQKRSLPWLGPLLGVVAATTYALTAGAEVHTLAFSLLYLLSATFAALSVVELLRREERSGGRLLPLMVASAALPLIAVASVIAAVVTLESQNTTPALPDLKAIGLLAYLTCAIVTLLFLARSPDAGGTDEPVDPFPVVAADKLARAREAAEGGWTLLAVSLDDTESLRVAGGEVAFRRILARFGANVRSSFPADADIGADGTHGYLVLISRPDGVIRDCLRDLLERVSTVTPDQPLAVEFSTSIGWARTADCGYDIATLTAAARQAMERAQRAGGHRWERALPVR
ncbi:hypothetical protein [Microbacterium atlanticum]|uniref:hypothetical protein n=1 Tax=Microbacterium atlanticum TaxID=2782168 RepID=UPI0018886302|nr:hypothetical protein [Microbacterium atlanticum]